MKKIILSMVFVFASFTMVNANSNIELVNVSMLGKDEVTIDCIEYAWNRASELSIGKNWSDWDLWDVTDVLYDDCMAEQQ